MELSEKDFTDTSMNKILKNHRAILFVFALGLLLRLGYVLTLDEKIYWEDEQDYLALSQRIVQGEGYVDDSGNPTAFRPVGYPLFLTVPQFISANNVLLIRIIQALVAALSLLLVYWIAFLVFNKKVAIVAALWTAVYPYFIFMPGTILPTTWYSFLLLAATLALYYGVRKNEAIYFALAANLYGMSVLVRPSGIALVLAAGIWLLWRYRQEKLFSFDRIVLFALIVMFACAPWVYRNYHVLDVPNFASNGGRNLWLGNNPRSGIQSGSNIEMPAELQRKIDAASSEAVKDRIYKEEAVTFIRNNPEIFVINTIGKALAFWRFDPSPTTGGYTKYDFKIRMLGILSFAPVFLFAFVGYLFASGRAKKDLNLWLYYAILFTLLHAIFIVKVRFRLPLDHFLIIAGSYGVIRIWSIEFAWKEKIAAFYKQLWPFKSGVIPNRIDVHSDSYLAQKKYTQSEING